MSLSIKTKLVLSFSFISALLFSIVFFVASLWYRGEQLKNVDTFLETEVRWIAETMVSYYSHQSSQTAAATDFVHGPEYAAFIQDFLLRRADKPLIYKTTFSILDQNDQALMTSNNAIDLDLRQVAARDGRIFDQRVLDDSGFLVSVNDSRLNYRLAYFPIQSDGIRLGAVRLGCLLDPVGMSSGTFSLLLSSFLVFVLLSNLVGGLFLATRILRPVELMRQRVDQINEDNLNFRLEELAGHDELSRLANTFNRTIERIETAYRSEEALVHDLSHQLRTPLTALRGGMEIALRKDRRVDEYRHVLEDSLSEVDRITTLLNTMLNLAKLDGHLAGIERRKCNLLELLGEIVDELGPLWAESRIHFDYHVDFMGDGPASTVSYSDALLIPGDVLSRFGIEADPFRLKQAMVNIFDNAHRYAPEGSGIDVTVRIDRQVREYRVTVANKGAPIPEKSLERVFERFYQGAGPDSPKTGTLTKQGFGLGLSIAKRIVELHGGRIRAYNPEAGGAAFEICLPASRP